MSDANMLAPDSAWGKLYADSITRAQTFTSAPDVWDTIDYAAAHMYDVQERFDDPDTLDAPMQKLRQLMGDKPFLSSELCLNSPRFQQRTYRLALLMGEIYHKNLTLLDAAALLFCWTLVNVNQPSFGWTRSLCVADPTEGFTPTASSHQLRVFGAYSRHIHAGMTRIACDCDDPDLLPTVFTGTDGRCTLVLLNRSTKPKRVSLSGIDITVEQAEQVDPYHPNHPYPFHENDQAWEVPPGGIITLVGTKR